MGALKFLGKLFIFIRGLHRLRRALEMYLYTSSRPMMLVPPVIFGAHVQLHHVIEFNPRRPNSDSITNPWQSIPSGAILYHLKAWNHPQTTMPFFFFWATTMPFLDLRFLNSKFKIARMDTQLISQEIAQPSNGLIQMMKMISSLNLHARDDEFFWIRQYSLRAFRDYLKQESFKTMFKWTNLQSKMNDMHDIPKKR